MAEESPPGICQAYSNQYTRDFSTFLRLRSVEITTNGCMVLAFQGRSRADFSNSGCCVLFELLAKSLHDMSSEVCVTFERVLMPVKPPSLSVIFFLNWVFDIFTFISNLCST